ncbi:MAG: hypothetical protein JNL80_11915 [Phycisphaerae bacterium]|nr:hypothetical protein [Phycisphaerae bacterium]
MRHQLSLPIRAARLLATVSVVATMAFAPPPADTAGDKLRTDAAALAPLTNEPLAKAFLEATRDLPVIAPRTIWRSADRSKAITDSAYQALPEAERSQYTKRDCDATFYWNTGYGSPLAYLRPIEIAASHGLKDVRGKRIADFGFGTIGHVRLLASLGADVHGIDVEPLFQALYSEPGDTGTVTGREGVEGSASIHIGRWPADATTARDVGGGYDLLLSKNTLKRGYIHPAREVDPKFLVHLGVDDATFLKSVRDALKPGGLFLLYNICPAQNPPDKPYLPHADGQCPWDRSALEAAGFEVLAYDVHDIEALLPIWKVLGYDDGADDAKLRANLFVRYTVARRVSSPTLPAGSPGPAR